MKRNFKSLAVALTSIALSIAGPQAAGQRLVILHTNDTHSNIDTSAAGVGGIVQRKAVIDSVRGAEPNMLLIDAGDAVQGSLYFKFFKGDVEYPLMNMMGYDVRILGNHEFDNGLAQLANYWKDVQGSRLSANYDFTGTPAEGLFSPYVIKEIAGRKVGIMGLNIDPASLIAEECYGGMKYADVVETANRVAAQLRKEGCDLVVAVTHIGYTSDNDKPDDRQLAALSKDIDVIIGGHSHTFVNPATPDATPYWFENADGKPVLVVQTGKNGSYIGEISLDLSDFVQKKIDYKWIPVTDRFAPEAYSKVMLDFLAPYRAGVDSVNSNVIGRNVAAMENGRGAGTFANWAGDFAARYGRQVVDSLRSAGHDLAPLAFGMMNVGGIRMPMPEGDVKEGQILATFPFSNRLRLISLKGADVIATMAIVAPKGGEAVSAEVTVATDSAGNMRQVLIDGRPVDPEKDYVICTIDYIANGNDDMLPMKHHTEIWRDNVEVSLRILDYIKALTAAGVPVMGDVNPRFVVADSQPADNSGCR
ncbi:MAG: bifunctional metallophosphatase/5'-nucleotidase [Muribaculaceae bacterium]|nr:bifunctional metallophosphatase/5'-nucleotidase [Muribaculaceae bacterium]